MSPPANPQRQQQASGQRHVERASRVVPLPGALGPQKAGNKERVAPGNALDVEALLAFEHGLRTCQTGAELSYFIVNEIRAVLPARQVILQRQNGGRRGLRIEAITSIATPQADAPLAQWLNKKLENKARNANPDERAAHAHAYPIRFRLPAVPDALGKTAYAFPYVLKNPLFSPDGRQIGSLSFLSDQPFDEKVLPLSERLSQACAHALSLHWRARATGALFSKPTRLILCAGLFAAMFIPVPLMAVAPASVVADNPQVVTAPINGVIENIHVSPDTRVTAGTLLFSFERTELQNTYDLVQRDVAIAEAKLRRANQDAFAGGNSRRELAVAAAELDLARTRAAAAKRRLDQSQVRALSDGLVLFSSVEDWVGKPVSTGERVMRIADPARSRLEIELETSDAILLEQDAVAKIFFDAEPLSPITATITRKPYDARMSERQTLVYPLSAVADSDQQSRLRIGQRAMAQVFGEYVPLWYFLLRKPLSVIRQKTGL